MNRSIYVFWILFLIIAAVCGVNTAAWAFFPGHEKITDPDLLRQARGIGGTDIIVTLADGDGSPGARQMKSAQRQALRLQEKTLSVLSTQQVRVSRKITNLPIFSANVNGEGLRALAARKEVAFIEPNHPLELFTAQGIPLIHPGSYRTQIGGTGVAVAVIDTGINCAHPAFGGSPFPNEKVLGGYDFGENDSDPSEELTGWDPQKMKMSTHGTACAAIVAGLPTGFGDYAGGVAPQAKLYALKVKKINGLIMTDAMLAAVDWCITHQQDDPGNPIMVISMSIGASKVQGSQHCDKKSPAMKKVFDRAAQSNITVFIASGNDSQTNSISFTACLSNTISVGAVYDADIGQYGPDATTQPDQVTHYSNSAEILDLLAPGSQLFVPAAPGKAYMKTFSGTSAACPHAAGAAALIQSTIKAKTGRFLAPARLRALMITTGDKIKDQKSGYITPRINISNAIAAALGTAPPPSGTSKAGDGSSVVVDDSRISDFPQNNRKNGGNAYESVVDWQK